MTDIKVHTQYHWEHCEWSEPTWGCRRGVVVPGGGLTLLGLRVSRSQHHPFTTAKSDYSDVEYLAILYPAWAHTPVPQKKN